MIYFSGPVFFGDFVNLKMKSVKRVDLQGDESRGQSEAPVSWGDQETI